MQNCTQFAKQKVCPILYFFLCFRDSYNEILIKLEEMFIKFFE